MKICVVGGGPVGCLAACMFAQEGHDVTVFEKRPDPRTCPAKGGRSINLSLSTRGIDALAAVNLAAEVINGHSVPCNGRLIHKIDGTCVPSFYGLKRELLTHSINRTHLNNVLLNATERYPNIQQHFMTKIIRADLTKGKLIIECRASQRVLTVGPFDIILGCDGAHSVVRSEMLRLGQFAYSQMSISHGYVEMKFPAATDGQFVLPPNFVHIWPRGDFLMIALPNLDRTYTVSLFLPTSQFDEINASGPNGVLKFFKENFPDAVHLIGEQELIDAHPLLPSSLMTITCEPYHFGRAALLGDAAHAVVPFYAQGMNAGLEDCLILSDILRDALKVCNEETFIDVPAVLEKYSSLRVPDGHAISKLSLYNYHELSTLVLKPTFKFRKTLDNSIHRFLGSNWELLYNSVTFSRKRYSHCLERKKTQDEVLQLTAWIALLSVIGIFFFHAVFP